MRKLQRTVNKAVGVLLFLSIVTFSYTLLSRDGRSGELVSLALSPEDQPLLLPNITNSDTEVVTTATTVANQGSVLGAGAIFWTQYSKNCPGGTTQANHCLLPGSAIKVKKVNMDKEHHGLQFADWVGTSEKVPIEWRIEYKNGKYVKVPIKWKTFQYCDTSAGDLESAAQLNLSPISYPTVLNGQNISTRRYSGKEGEEVWYVKIDTSALEVTSPDQYKDFCSRQKKSASGRYLFDTMADMYIYNAPGYAYNGAQQISDTLVLLCSLTPADQLDAVIKELWDTDDKDKDRVAVRVGIESNFAALDVKDPFRTDMKDKIIGWYPYYGGDYINNWAFQVRGAKQARILNTNRAATLISGLYLTDKKTIAETALKPDLSSYPSSTIMSIAPDDTTYQMESEAETVKAAIIGGVWHMSEEVITDSSNLALLSWNPNTLSTSEYMCDKFEDRCPIIRNISGCSGAGAAKADIRFRQLTIGVNDTQPYAGIREDDEPTDAVDTSVNANYVREEHLVNLSTQTPTAIIDKASIDQLILATGKGTPACLAAAKAKVEQLPDYDISLDKNTKYKYSEAEMEELKKAIDNGFYLSSALLVTPFNVKYKAWVNYFVDEAVLAECRSYGGCKGVAKDMIPGYNGQPYEVKVVNGDIDRGAFLSFSIAGFMRGLSNFDGSSIQQQYWKEDFKAALAQNKIYEDPGAKVDCDETQYWICGAEGIIKCSTTLPPTEVIL